MNSSTQSSYCRLIMPQPLSVVLRAEASGPALAHEPVTTADLSDAVAVTWRDQCLRRGHPEQPLAELAVTVVPVFAEGSQGPSCQGFGLEVQLPDGRIRRQQFNLKCLRPVATRAAEALIAAGILGEQFHYFYGLTVDAVPAPPSSAIADSARLALNIKSPPPACLRLPLRPLLRQATAIGPQDEEAFHVFFTAEALAKAETCSRRGAASAPPVESGAVLLGSLAYCDDTEEFFVVVTDALEVDAADQTTFSLAYSGQSWHRIQSVMKARQAAHPARAERLLGQCHGHNFLPNDGVRCEECDKRLVCTLTSVFMSQDDQIWMRAVFTRQPWALCHIFGLNARKEPVQQLYTLQGGLWQARGYFLLPESERNSITTNP